LLTGPTRFRRLPRYAEAEGPLAQTDNYYYYLYYPYYLCYYLRTSLPYIESVLGNFC